MLTHAARRTLLKAMREANEQTTCWIDRYYPSRIAPVLDHTPMGKVKSLFGLRMGSEADVFFDADFKSPHMT